MLFFAVGSNMDEGRMHQLDPSARRITIGSLPGYALAWNKRSRSGGKLAPSRTHSTGDVIWGVVYELDEPGRALLELAQRAARYVAEPVVVHGSDGVEHRCTLYVAPPEMVDDSLLPTAAYRDPIVAAARASGLPSAYVDALARTPVAEE